MGPAVDVAVVFLMSIRCDGVVGAQHDSASYSNKRGSLTTNELSHDSNGSAESPLMMLWRPMQ